MTDPITFDDLPDSLRRIVDDLSTAIIAAGRTPEEAVEPAKAVRKLLDGSDANLSAYSRQTLEHAVELMEAEILNRVVAAHQGGRQ